MRHNKSLDGLLSSEGEARINLRRNRCGLLDGEEKKDDKGSEMGEVELQFA